MAAIQRSGQPNSATQDISHVVPYRVALHMDPGPRYLVNKWDRQRKRWIERSVSATAYSETLSSQLSYALPQPHLFSQALFGKMIGHDRPHDFTDKNSRVVGRENIAGHDCIRLETEEQTLWFDAASLLLRRIVKQQLDRGYASRVIDTYFELRPIAANDIIEQSPIADEKFEDSIMQWVPFIPFEQMLENLRLTGRASGLLITPRQDQPLAQPALPPLNAEQLASIVTIEGDALSGLGFYSRYQNSDFLVTDVRLITKNRWLKIRDRAGQKMECLEAFQGEGSNVAVIKMTRVPGRLQPSTAPKKGLNTYLLCAFNTKDGAMRPAFCVSRPHPAGRYEVSLQASDSITGSPIIDVESGTAVGILIESDLGQPKRAGVPSEGWHAEPLFTHQRWGQLGLVPQR